MKSLFGWRKKKFEISVSHSDLTIKKYKLKTHNLNPNNILILDRIHLLETPKSQIVNFLEKLFLFQKCYFLFPMKEIFN